MQVKKSDVIKRAYEKISPNFPPELEAALHTVIKNSTITDIINFTIQHSKFFMILSDELNKRELREQLKYPVNEIEPIPIYSLGNYVYRKICDMGHKELLLTNDIFVFPSFSKWIFSMRSLSSQILRGGMKVYYSTKAPELEIVGRKYRIAYTRHCIERIHERANGKRYEYGSLGDLFSLLNDNNYHELVTLSDGSRALSMFGFASNEESLSFKIVTKIMGDRYYPEDKHYYRLGYFPIDIVNNFAVCRTLLCPGFLNTPEYKLLKDSPENIQWLKRANENERNGSWDTFDLELIKKLHELGIPQIKVLNDDVYTFR